MSQLLDMHTAYIHLSLYSPEVLAKAQAVHEEEADERFELSPLACRLAGAGLQLECLSRSQGR